MIYKTETHCHTRESSYCGRMFAKDLVKAYVEKKYKTIIITNHYSYFNFNSIYTESWDEKIDYLLKGYNEAKKLSESMNINILFALELTLNSTNSDYLIYGITEKFLRENKYLYELSLSELVTLCQDNNFLIVQAHPFRDGMQLAPVKYKMPMEAFNGLDEEESRNKIAMRYAKDNNLIGLSGSDAHRLNDIAKGGIITDIEIKTIEDYIDCVLKKEFIIITSQ